MYKNHLTYRTSSEPLNYRISRSRNPLGIGKTNFIWDRQRQQLVLILESNQMFSQEAKAFLRENRLILEAPLISSFDKPFRTHLIERKVREEFEMGIMETGIAEVMLKPGYQYSLLSFQVIDPSLIKVILGYRPLGRNNHN